MKEFLKSGRFKILLAVLAVLIGFMVASVYDIGFNSTAENVADTLLQPFQKMSASISNTVDRFLQKQRSKQILMAENKALLEENRKLREDLITQEELKHRLKQYQEIADIQNNHADWQLLPANIIVRDNAQSRFYSFTIDKGTRQGVAYLDPVMTKDGLVGYVVEVGANSAKVLTILDVKVNVGAYDAQTRDIGVVGSTVESAGNGFCILNNLARGTQIAEGDFILTSGGAIVGSSFYPRGIPIGTVVRTGQDAHSTGPYAVIKPFADIPNATEVFVITDFAEKAPANTEVQP